jgi:CRISPR system Cascade subunit CasC
MDRRFIQIHFLTSYPAALLNRDDVGFAKRLLFGGTTRTRISSQCLKRHWRTFEGEHALSETGVPMSVRSRVTFERQILAPLIADGHDQELATQVTGALMAKVLGESSKAKRAKGEKDDQPPQVRTGQITILGRPEVEYLLEQARAICKTKPKKETAVKKAVDNHFKGEAGSNLRALRHAAGLDAAMFGRMVTSDILARGDAAIHVAHAFTVHDEEVESDYFTAVDDLLSQGDDAEAGSGHLGNTELTSGLYYGYVVVDVPLLVSNLEGCAQSEWNAADRELAGDLVGRLVHLVATVSPGAKLGSTAPYAWAQWVFAESGSSQPRTLANAFLRPVSPRPDLLGNTYAALRDHLAGLNRMYGATTERRMAGLGPVDTLKDICGGGETLDSVAQWAAAQVRGT